MQLPETSEYRKILLSNPGLLDVRAPVEFNQGAFPHATNLPLLDDEERRRVGICYKQKGQQHAIKLGHELVSGNTKQQRIDKWIEFTKQHNTTYLYCLRGGLRSKISQQWLHEADIEIPRVQGGYKALRRFLVKQIEFADSEFDFTLIGGLTGSRKTQLIKQLKNGIDLEGAANHRGSSFGAHASPPNSQINFENQISIDLLRADHEGHRTLTLEDESRFIGSVDIPKNIYTKMRSSPLVVIETPIQQRLQQLLKEYVTDMEQEFIDVTNDHELAFKEFSKYLKDSLLRIRKRLGMEKWQQLDNNLQFALKQHKINADTSHHIRWLEPLLKEYYDPMYSSQLEKRKDSIVFRGTYDECHQYINQRISQNY
ncbi:MAG: tRNA 2-selenouridine(34) synthase MnmH [Gammaproteobacteria bacterium]|nr:tRNA 2-selenouridine(34) synthase MnmH [Gammaproteobacteria bacterium]